MKMLIMRGGESDARVRLRISNGQNIHPVEEGNLWTTDDPHFLHGLAEFGGLHEFFHLRGGVPLAPDHHVVGSLAVAADVETFFTRGFAERGEGLDRPFPLRVVGDFVTDHDMRHTIPFPDSCVVSPGCERAAMSALRKVTSQRLGSPPRVSTLGKSY